ncbi:unnamed protein product [Timema podura]|uniref:C2H2-type domain-containing protein n=1 Tax=Timema podura TaxID=61482 RepID=A0ABN7NBM4_TIMPD|nr:unnamed protein product [Timema podura]
MSEQINGIPAYINKGPGTGGVRNGGFQTPNCTPMYTRSAIVTEPPVLVVDSEEWASVPEWVGVSVSESECLRVGRRVLHSCIVGHRRVKFWKSPPQHCLQLNSQSETTWDTSHFMLSLQKNGFGAINESVVPESSHKPPPKQCFVCPQCARIYQRKESLYLHQKHECGKEPQFFCPYCTYRAKLKGNLRTCILPGSNPDLPIFGSLVSYESFMLDHTATEAGVKFWKSPPQHCLQLNSQSETTWDTSHFMSSLQEQGFGAINDSVVPESSHKPPSKQGFYSLASFQQESSPILSSILKDDFDHVSTTDPLLGTGTVQSLKYSLASFQQESSPILSSILKDDFDHVSTTDPLLGTGTVQSLKGSDGTTTVKESCLYSVLAKAESMMDVWKLSAKYERSIKIVSYQKTQPPLTREDFMLHKACQKIL